MKKPVWILLAAVLVLALGIVIWQTNLPAVSGGAGDPVLPTARGGEALPGADPQALNLPPAETEFPIDWIREPNAAASQPNAAASQSGDPAQPGGASAGPAPAQPAQPGGSGQTPAGTQPAQPPAGTQAGQSPSETQPAQPPAETNSAASGADVPILPPDIFP